MLISHYRSLDTSRDLDWLDAEIKKGGTRYLVGDTVTAADTMMAFGVQFIFATGSHPEEKEGQWDNVHKWLETIEKNVVYQRAVKRTGHKLG